MEGWLMEWVGWMNKWMELEDEWVNEWNGGDEWVNEWSDEYVCFVWFKSGGSHVLQNCKKGGMSR